MSATPPGWFPDPGNSGGVRWWDGTTWTEHVHAPSPLSAAGPWAPAPTSALRSAGRTRWAFAPALLLVLIGGVERDYRLLVFVAIVFALSGVFALTVQRHFQRQASASARAAGGLWGGAASAAPRNQAAGQRDWSFLQTFSPKYWQSVARGTLVIYPQTIVFEPRRPSPRKAPQRITADEVASSGAARNGFAGILDMHLRNGDKQRFQLSVAPGSLNDILRRAGFPVS